MFEKFEIAGVQGREILDSRGNPTVEVEVMLDGGAVGRAAVPSGASTGKFEAVELRDGGPRYHGKGVHKAVENVNNVLAEAVAFENALDQKKIDQLLREADGTENKSKLGANAVLGVSMAVARAAANALEIPLYRYLGGIYGTKMPVPMMNILNGGVHADNTVDLQEFMIMPVGADNFREGLQMCAEIYHTLKNLLKTNNYSTAVGDEGGFAPNLKNTEEVLSYLVDAISLSGFQPGSQVGIAIDAASSELYDEATGMYIFPGESQMSGIRVERDAQEMVEYYRRLIEGFPIISIEDGLQEEDWQGWQLMTKTLGHKVQLIGDDLFVTNTNFHTPIFSYGLCKRLHFRQRYRIKSQFMKIIPIQYFFFFCNMQSQQNLFRKFQRSCAIGRNYMIISYSLPCNIIRFPCISRTCPLL